MATSNLREPVVAGQFYPAGRGALAREVATYVGAREPWPLVGGLGPHAGYMYSGATAGALFARLEVPAAVVLLGPKHHGLGAPYAVWPEGAWRTPLGDSPVDAALAQALLDAAPALRADEAAHLREHSLEVILPFVQYVNAEAAIVPVALGPMPAGTLAEIGRGIARALAPRRGDAVIVVSSDMTHYEAAATAESKDRLAIERLEALDAPGLLDAVRQYEISMCGVWPAAAALVALRELGATRGELLTYANSGETSGDFDHVVGYAAVAFS